MKRVLMRTLTLLGVAVLVHHAPAQETQVPSQAELWRIVQKQAQEIEMLKKQLRRLEGDTLTNTEKLESMPAGSAEGEGSGEGPGILSQVGGYGELHFNKLDDQHGTKDTRSIDYHRFVLFFNHEFNERMRFVSELELEHSLSGDGKPGEIELEQAYVEMDLGEDQAHSVRAGLFLVPVGIINETHEPPTFYGSERNPIEKNIIPTTWWEGGIGVSGALPLGFEYDFAYTSGLAVDDSYKIRDGRQKVAKAAAENGAYTARLRWLGPGLELGVSGHYQEDLTQGGVNGAPEDSEATLVEAHAIWSHGPFSVRGLYARWDLDGDTPEMLGRDVQQGWYVEPSWKFNDKFGVFARYNVWNNEAGRSDHNEVEQFDIGLSYWPHENVVVKVDYQNQDAADDVKELDGVNLSIGYQW